MKLFCLGRPTILPKEGYYILRGHLTCGSIHKEPKFIADFHFKKSNVKQSPLITNDNHELEPREASTPGGMFYKLFVQSERRLKKETDAEFKSRCSNKWGGYYIFYHYKDSEWCWDNPNHQLDHLLRLLQS